MAELLKHRLAKTAIERIASVLSRIHPQFAASDFIQQSLDGLDALELKERVQHIISVLAQHLSPDFAGASITTNPRPLASQQRTR